MLKYSLVFIGLVAAPVWATHFDPPDLNLEDQLHRNYVQVVDPKQRAETPSEGLMESYRLQKGESLWGLSQMLYGDGAYWPKVWAQNKSITNPHLVRPGHTLQLMLGSEDQTPAFRFSESDDSGIELAAAQVPGGSQVEVPPPEISPRPVLKIPSSFPDWQEVYHSRKDDFEIDDSKLLFKRNRIPDKIFVSGYVQDGELDAYGSFLENENESGLPVAMQYIFIKIKKGMGHIGQKMLIVKDHGILHKLNYQVEGDIKARFIEVFGDIEIVETAEPVKNGPDKEKFDVYRALITHAFSLSILNYDLVPGKVDFVDLSASGPSGSVVAQVIGSSKDVTSALYGPGDIVFLNKGSQDGVATGQLLDLFADRVLREPRTAVAFSTKPAGSVKVVKVDNHCATAVVLSAVDSVLQGDRAQQQSRAEKSQDLDLNTPVKEDFEAPLEPEPIGDSPDLDLSE